VIPARGLRVAFLSASLAVTSACVTYRGPRGIESAIEEQMGVDLERDFGLKLGWTTTKLAGSFVGGDDADDALAFKDLTGLGVAVFRVPKGASSPAHIDPARLLAGHFETVLNVRDSDGQVLLLAKPQRGTIKELVFVSCDEEEVVIARLRGDLDRLLEQALQAADEGGVAGARRAVPVAAR